jgi:hypothetical protein
MTAAEWISRARELGAPIGISCHNGRRHLSYPVDWPSLPNLPHELGKDVADLLEAEGRQTAA